MRLCVEERGLHCCWLSLSQQLTQAQRTSLFYSNYFPSMVCTSVSVMRVPAMYRNKREMGRGGGGGGGGGGFWGDVASSGCSFAFI